MIITKPVNYRVSQLFGQNACSFYIALGLRGHNGIDYASPTGSDCRWNCDKRGEVIEVSDSPTYGKKIVVMVKNDDGRWYKFYYGHLKDFFVKEGNVVDCGDLLGHTDNTGKYTTGPHCHFGFYECSDITQTLNKNNGYDGALDPRNTCGVKYLDMYVCEYLAKLNQAVGILQKLIEAVKELLRFKNRK